MSKPTTTERLKIGELLVAEGLLMSDQLHAALALQQQRGGRIVEICIAEGYFDARQFLHFLANTRTSASIDLLNYAIPREVIDLLPPHFVIKHQVLPIDKMGKLLTVGMACPLDTATITEMEAMTGCRIKPMLVGINDVLAAITRYYGDQKPTFEPSAALLGGAAPGKQMAADAYDHLLPSRPKPAKPAGENGGGPARVLAKAESGIRMEGVIQLVRRLHSLPALPETVARVRALMDDPKADARAVEEAIATDPGIVAKVVSLANSAAYGFQHQVDTLESATRLLGLRDIYNLVLSAAVVDYFKASRYFDYRRFWRHSQFCALASKLIATDTHTGDPGTSYLSGLLHGLGRVALAEVVPERYREVDQEALIGDVIRKEEELFGIAHPEVGYMLADIWDLPNDITLPVRYHRNIEMATEFQQHTAVVGLAALMTDAYGKVTKDNVRQLAESCRSAMGILGIPDKQFITILTETGKAFKAAEH